MNSFPWQGVAWDIDGTLLDSEPLHARSLTAVCEMFGVAVAADDAQFVGMHIIDVWNVLRPLFPAGTTEADFMVPLRAYYRNNASDLAIIPGARDVITALHDAGVRQVCVSNSTRDVVDINLATLGMNALLQGALSLDDVTRGKPAPDPYLQGAALLGLPVDAVLAVEDSPTGVRSAQAAGLAVAMYVPAGHPEPTDVTPDFIISRLDQIPLLIPR
ncbi:HAD-superfamily hydrolase [Ketogulonicigenium robustum]|uniref:HAD-superfamily hydrolase n=1 Tax=Ketogulonicigenium robustum TaxID=92947 RepID=A0A1W6P0C8_9RHOB|nr:HAD family phosphatase [Ketogulonicigenium robustum]ARO14727.1 HAD-superfamily hydrolase [Ketogulonicigenium robustum]